LFAQVVDFNIAHFLPPNKLLKNARLLKFPSSFAVRRTRKYASRLRISGALHPDIFE
jgi:hypothetical protein